MPQTAAHRAPLLSQHLLAQAAGSRCGLAPPVHLVDAQPCDAPGPLFGGKPLFNAATPKDPANAWQTVSGAVALARDQAVAGALAEALERLAAAQTALPLRLRADIPDDERLDDDAFALYSRAQRSQADFPWPMEATDHDCYAAVYRLGNNREFWVPQELVGLGPRSGAARMPSTSSGLAAWRDQAGGPWLATLRAAQELLERDALATTWLNGLGGRQLTLPADWQAYAADHGGELAAFDLTQAWNPQPVIAVAGGMPYRGRPRFVLGIACRASLGAALHKALLEWSQALTFAAHLANGPSDELPREAGALRRFDQHAVFYTLRPDLWRRSALLAHAAPAPATVAAAEIQADAPDVRQAAEQLRHLQLSLEHSGIDLYYRELTTVDVAACGLRVMRVLSPQLSGLHADERAPFLGGRCADVEWRYPGSARHTPFPNPLPHPLG
ncbi:YcaO-like family protein [Candidimonas humi]|uniref:YcaO-like family protein n=1 Tax=Candidimonas humi TaxID=683355 RepID=A0ABV8NXP7_9BURK|nr:YcaO-like family protein [Candidimonas humi]MBV6304989.1 YcaO-like family protein [Candidimonas humi]